MISNGQGRESNNMRGEVGGELDIKRTYGRKVSRMAKVE